MLKKILSATIYIFTITISSSSAMETKDNKAFEQSGLTQHQYNTLLEQYKIISSYNLPKDLTDKIAKIRFEIFKAPFSFPCIEAISNKIGTAIEIKEAPYEKKPNSDSNRSIWTFHNDGRINLDITESNNITKNGCNIIKFEDHEFLVCNIKSNFDFNTQPFEIKFLYAALLMGNRPSCIYKIVKKGEFLKPEKDHTINSLSDIGQGAYRRIDLQKSTATTPMGIIALILSSDEEFSSATREGPKCAPKNDFENFEMKPSPLAMGEICQYQIPGLFGTCTHQPIYVPQKYVDEAYGEVYKRIFPEDISFYKMEAKIS